MYDKECGTYYISDWEVLHLLLQQIPLVLQNKALVLSKEGNKDIDLLVEALCLMVSLL